MATYPMHFAKTNLSALVVRAEAGEEVILTRGKEPVVRLVPVPRPHSERRPGRLAGRITVGPEFFDPLPDDELAAWEGD
jgi:antitoxin (DNA-binding transcriptional repressor) of toxin-antitoxin stability system